MKFFLKKKKKKKKENHSRRAICVEEVDQIETLRNRKKKSGGKIEGTYR